MSASIERVTNNAFDTSMIVLDHLTNDEDDEDQLFLLPERVLAMDSLSFREDVASIAPSFLPAHHHLMLNNNNNNSSNNSNHNHLSSSNNNSVSPHNSLDSTDSNKSVRLADDKEGLKIVRASDGCKTLWLCKTEFLFQKSILNITST